MKEPALPLQEAVVTALRSNTAVDALVAKRVYDFVPGTEPGNTAKFPCISFGESSSRPYEESDCIDSTEHSFTIYCWSRTAGYPECKRMAAAVRAALHDADLTVTGFSLVLMQWESTDFRRDDDGSNVAALSFRALLDPV